MTNVEITQNGTNGLSPDCSVTLVTRSGFTFHARPARPDDDAALSEFFGKVGSEDLRFRFLTALSRVGDEQIAAMTHLDHRRTENFLAFAPDDKTIIATAMLAADPNLESAEVAMATRADMKGKGISWTLLDHVARCARRRGFRTIRSIESRDNHTAIELEREMGFKAKPYPGDASLVLVEAVLAPESDPA